MPKKMVNGEMKGGNRLKSYLKKNIFNPAFAMLKPFSLPKAKVKHNLFQSIGYSKSVWQNLIPEFKF